MKVVMKQALIFSAPLLAVAFLAGCGKYEKQPVSDIAEVREEAKVTASGPLKPAAEIRYVIQEKEVKVATPVDRVQIVEKPYAVTTVTPNEISIAKIPDGPTLVFNEGQKSTFQFRVSISEQKTKVRLTSDSLPKDAVLKDISTEKDPGLYELTWTPPLHTVASGTHKEITLKLTGQVSETANEKKRKSLEGLSNDQQFTILVFPTQGSPSDLVVEGLSNQLLEGTITPFQVTVVIPGVDKDVAVKPSLKVSYDGVSISAGNSFREMDGARFVNDDLDHK